jgi:hypothetical protein
MDFAWRVIGSLTFGLMMSFVTGDFFVEKLHGLTLASLELISKVSPLGALVGKKQAWRFACARINGSG